MLVALCRNIPVAGRKIHDTDVAATMLTHGERRLPTFNAKDFRRFEKRVERVEIESVE